MSIQALIQEDVARAQQLRRSGSHSDAAATFEAVIKRLKRELRVLPSGPAGDSKCDILALLSQTHGSLAGNWRDAGRTDRVQYRLAIRYYDEGNQYEAERREHCGTRGLDTYNMLQRLVVRLLDNQALLESDEPCVDGKNMPAALDEVRVELDRQISAGRRDSWALADRALVRFLCNMDAVAQDLESLQETSADKSFYSTSAKVVNDLLSEGLGKGTQLAERLRKFEGMLRSKGGLALT